MACTVKDDLRCLLGLPQAMRLGGWAHGDGWSVLVWIFIDSHNRKWLVLGLLPGKGNPGPGSPFSHSGMKGVACLGDHSFLPWYLLSSKCPYELLDNQALPAGFFAGPYPLLEGLLRWC